MILGWTANIFLITAMILIGWRWRHAFLLTFIGEVLWLIESIRIERPDMVFICITFGVLAIWNWMLWGLNQQD